MNPTRVGKGAAFLALALFAAAIAFRDFFVEVALLLVLMVILAEAVWVSLALRSPESRFIFAREERPEGNRVILYSGDDSEERVLLTKKVGGTAELESKVSFQTLEPDVIRGAGSTAIRFKFGTDYAGDYSARDVGVKVTGPLGLFSSGGRVPFEQSYVVYPRVLQIAASTVKLLGRTEIGETPIQMPGVGSEYYEMRGYQPGDDFRSVNWKATAREGELIVVEHMREVGSSFLLVLDVRAPGFRETDSLASTFLSIANSLRGAGVSFGILVHDGTRVLGVSSQQDPRASLALALKAAISVAKLDATPEYLELVPLGITSKFAGIGPGEDSVLTHMEDLRREELGSVLENVDPWAEAASYVRDTQTRSVIYVSGLFGDVQPLIELAWESKHYRDADFVVANPCDLKTGDRHPAYERMARALNAASVRYHRGEPVDLARQILTV